jgi:hypothetical protein
MCLHQQAFSSIVRNPVGFSFINEGSEAKPKWGYVGNTTGATLRLELSSEVDTDSTKLAIVYLAHLKSYSNMGTAEVK